MDEKTEELRDIFLSVADDETVTEEQRAGTGSLLREEDDRAEIREVVETMREELHFETALAPADLVTVVVRFYAGDSDEAIAEALGDESLEHVVSRARFDLHLVRDEDLEVPFSRARFRELEERGLEDEEIAHELGVDASTITRFRRVLETQAERRNRSDRFRLAFEEQLADRDIAERLTASLQETGLDGATADQEVDVDI